MLQPVLAHAIRMMTEVCLVTVRPDYLARLRQLLTRMGIVQAVVAHDTATLLGWLVETFSYQGVSDAVAAGYMREHGRLSMAEVASALDRGSSCPRLASHAAFQGCGYAKAARSCAEPHHLDWCPLPRHDLRNGRLNQIGYGLALFVRDRCDGDLVGWIDRQLAASDDPEAADRALLMRAALLEPLSEVGGLSYKVLSMALADLLLGAGEGKERWMVAGTGMVAIDSLVHNWMARTGILRDLSADHLYGPGCYRPGGCAAILVRCAEFIDARAFCPEGPRVFPRLVQHGIWTFCAASGFDLCNGHRIDDRLPCQQQACSVFEHCGRVPLRPDRYMAFDGRLT